MRKEELLAAFGKTLPDVIAPDLDVLFCGINPGLYTAAVQRHFGRPGNRFWPTIHKAGFTAPVPSIGAARAVEAWLRDYERRRARDDCRGGVDIVGTHRRRANPG